MIRSAICLLTLVSLAPTRAETLDEAELKELRAYIAGLKDGKPGDAAQVERLAAISWPGVVETMRAYAALKKPIEPHTHRAFQALLERTTRQALAPWPMVKLYSPELAAFLTLTNDKNAVGSMLFKQLQMSDTGRLSFDLCVRLTPTFSLEYLEAKEVEKKTELFDAWNRRLALGREDRPLPHIEKSLERIADSFELGDSIRRKREPHLRFIASWQLLRRRYLRWLRTCLEDPRDFAVEMGLKVQQRVPALLDLNEAVCTRFSDVPALVQHALRNYAFDESTDHSATLRKLWAKLPANQTRTRYQCLFAMGVHHKGNDAIALEAVEKDAYELFDVAIPILRHGAPERARRAVRHVLTKSERGHEEALRLARELKLIGFEEDALKIALDEKRDQILRQTAMLYLDNSEGKYRLKLLPMLAVSKADLRLTVIRVFLDKTGLSKNELREIGPTLVKVALADPSMGHRQEATYVLGCWKSPETTEFFRKLLCDNPAVVLSDGYYGDARYWQYRFRLMGLLGMAKLGDKKAREELLSLHTKGSPAEKMDVLLHFLDLGEMHEAAWGDLESPEPRLVATACQLIAKHGTAQEKERLKKHFADAPLWQRFRGSGIDDYNILRMAEGK